MTDGVAVSDTLVLRILLVEDETLTAMLIEDALALHGHVVVGVAGSAGEALAIADRDRPDMALCDIRLSDGADAGVAVAEALAKRGIVCLFLSGNCPLESTHDLIVGCMPKPFHTASIGTAVRSAYEIANGRTPSDRPAAMLLYQGVEGVTRP